MKKVVILGPESTGKTKLAIHLASVFRTEYVREFAREFLESLERPYTYEDLLPIAQGQVALEDEVTRRLQDEEVMFVDTDLTVIKVWSYFKFRRCDPWILEECARRKYDAYLLTYPDVEWQEDPLREHPGNRLDIFKLYEQDLDDRGIEPFIVKGEGDRRSEMAKDYLSRLGYSSRI